MSKNVLEKASFAFAIFVFGLAGWYWIRQIQSARELLEMAYG